MREMLIKGAAVLSMLGLTGIASAQSTPLLLEYDILDLGGGTYQYDFTLRNLNLDGSWVSGQNFDWIVFGDLPNSGGFSNLTDFIGDVSSLAGTAWADDGFSYSSGGHNGPTLLDFGSIPFGGFIPTFVGDSVSWSGTSTASLPQGELLWSTLIASGGNYANYEVAILVPAPVSGAVLGVAGLAFARRRR